MERGRRGGIVTHEADIQEMEGLCSPDHLMCLKESSEIEMPPDRSADP